MQIRVRQPKRDNDNFLPLINIVFLMLIFFLMASSIAPRADLDLQPPQSPDGERTAPPGDAIYLANSGMISAFGRETELTDLSAHLTSFLAGGIDKPIRIISDRDANGLLVLDIVDEVRRAGANDIRLMTLRGELK